MRSILRAIFAVVLLLGGGAGDWAPGTATALAHQACCCGVPSGVEDSCPCPKPEGNRGPSRSLCSERGTVVATVAVRRTQAEPRTEARPEPAAWTRASQTLASEGVPAPARGRDPDLGRHLARLQTFRI